jgi:Tfp pilus assembly protein PilF
MKSNACLSPKRAVLLSFVALVFCASTGAQILPGEATDSGLGGSNSVQGIVLGPSGERLEVRVRVRLETETRGARTAMTDDRGNFAFRGLVSGGYTVVIDKEEGFEPFTTSFDIFQLRGSPPQTYMLNIRLKAKAADIPKPAVVNAAFAGVPEKALQYFEKARELSENNDIRGSVEQFRLAVGEYPKFSVAYNELGVQYLKLGEIENAEQAFRDALEIDPESREALTNLGIALVQSKKYLEAEPLLRKAVEKGAQSGIGHYFLGQSLANQGKFDEAVKELVLSLELGGDRMNEARRILVIIYSSRGETARAAAELEIYLRVNPRAPDAVQLTQVLKKLKGESP